MYEDDNLLIEHQDNYIFMYYKIEELSRENVKEMLAFRNSLFDFPASYLFDARNIKWASIGAMQEMCSEPALRNITSSATIVTSNIGKLLGNMYYKMLATEYPTRLFNSFPEACKWLEKVNGKKVPPFYAIELEDDKYDLNLN